MSKKLPLKLATIAALMLVLLVPLTMISGLVEQRQNERSVAEASVRQSTAGPQSITGPLLIIPFSTHKTITERVAVREPIETALQPEPVVDATAKTTAVAAPPAYRVVHKTVQRTEVKHHSITVLPQRLRVDADAGVTTLRRGIYPLLTYAVDATLSGDFGLDVAARIKAYSEHGELRMGTPYLSIALADVRGLRNAPAMTWGNRKLAALPGARMGTKADGIHVPLTGLDLQKPQKYGFSVPLELAGMEQLMFSPVGKRTDVTLRSNWPHPSFTGRFLPVKRDITADGFTATWSTSWLATGIDQEFQHTGDHRARPHAAPNRHDFGVTLVNPVDVYLQTERTIKHAILFVLLTFAAFFLFEILKRLRIHPMQYLLVGLAQAVFYLLLVALSEHVPFAVAYLAGASACVALISYYLAAVLGNWARGGGFAALLAAVYGLLFGVLQSEDHALLLGATVVFAALASIMVLTRRLDWYELGGAPAA